jgi:hypothetical protein
MQEPPVLESLRWGARPQFRFRQLGHAADASFVQKARDPAHAAEVLSYAVGRVALFEGQAPKFSTIGPKTGNDEYRR